MMAPTISVSWKGTLKNRLELLRNMRREGFSLRELKRVWKKTSNLTVTYRDELPGESNVTDHANTLRQQLINDLRKLAQPMTTQPEEE